MRRLRLELEQEDPCQINTVSLRLKSRICHDQAVRILDDLRDRLLDRRDKLGIESAYLVQNQLETGSPNRVVLSNQYLLSHVVSA